MAVSRKNQLVGLDVGSHSVKLVEIDHAKKGLTLKSLGIIGLPPEAIVEGSIQETEVVSSAIRNLFRNLRVKNRNVAASISGYSVIAKRITLSGGAEAALETVVHQEAEQYVPFDMEEVNLDFDVLPGPSVSPPGRGASGGDQGADLMDVMLVAARKEVVNEYAALLDMAGLNPAVIDVDAFALQNAFELNHTGPAGCYALVNVGAEELGITIVKDGAALFTRDSSYGGAQITRAVMREFGVGFEEAEHIKLGGRPIENGEQRLGRIFREAVSEWANEIQRALVFVASTQPEASFECVYLSGGSSRIPGFRPYLESKTKIPAKPFNPFSALRVKEKAVDPAYVEYMGPQAAVAVGLALRSIGDK